MASPERSTTGRARTPGPWKNGPIPVIGLVGGIGSGKSAVAKQLERLGAFVIDADKVGHALLTQRPVRECVVAKFGAQVLDSTLEDGTEPMIDRRALGAIVFKDPVARKALESIVHPRMRRTFEKAIARVIRRGQARAVVLDAAILYEAGWNKLCDHVLYVDAPRELRLARLAAARGWDEATLSARESAQWALVEKRGRAEFEVSNVSDLEALGPLVQRVWTSLLSAIPVKRRPASGAETETEPSSRPRVARRSGKSSGPQGRR